MPLLACCWLVHLAGTNHCRTRNISDAMRERNSASDANKAASHGSTAPRSPSYDPSPLFRFSFRHLTSGGPRPNLQPILDRLLPNTLPAYIQSEPRLSAHADVCPKLLSWKIREEGQSLLMFVMGRRL